MRSCSFFHSTFWPCLQEVIDKDRVWRKKKSEMSFLCRESCVFLRVSHSLPFSADTKLMTQVFIQHTGWILHIHYTEWRRAVRRLVWVRLVRLKKKPQTSLTVLVQHHSAAPCVCVRLYVCHFVCFVCLLNNSDLDPDLSGYWSVQWLFDHTSVSVNMCPRRLCWCEPVCVSDPSAILRFCLKMLVSDTNCCLVSWNADRLLVVK